MPPEEVRKMKIGCEHDEGFVESNSEEEKKVEFPSSKGLPLNHVTPTTTQIEFYKDPSRFGQQENQINAVFMAQDGESKHEWPSQDAEEDAIEIGARILHLLHFATMSPDERERTMKQLVENYASGPSESFLDECVQNSSASNMDDTSKKSSKRVTFDLTPKQGIVSTSNENRRDIGECSSNTTVKRRKKAIPEACLVAIAAGSLVVVLVLWYATTWDPPLLPCRDGTTSSSASAAAVGSDAEGAHNPGIESTTTILTNATAKVGSHFFRTKPFAVLAEQHTESSSWSWHSTAPFPELLQRDHNDHEDDENVALLASYEYDNIFLSKEMLKSTLLGGTSFALGVLTSPAMVEAFVNNGGAGVVVVALSFVSVIPMLSRLLRKNMDHLQLAELQQEMLIRFLRGSMDRFRLPAGQLELAVDTYKGFWGKIQSLLMRVLRWPRLLREKMRVKDS